MKGVILAGGTGSRLGPLCKVTNKHLLPVGDKPMIQHSVEKLVDAGIKDIIVVSGVEHIGDVARFLGSGKNFKCNVTLKAQDEAGGIAQALMLTENCIQEDDNVCVILGDNIFEDGLTNYIEVFNRPEYPEGMVLLKEVHNPERYGVAVFNNTVGMDITDYHRLVSIEEKPKSPKSKFAVTGIYFYRCRCLFSRLRKLKPSARGELEISDLNNEYLQHAELNYMFMDGWWTDAGTLQSYALANQLVAKQTL